MLRYSRFSILALTAILVTILASGVVLAKTDNALYMLVNPDAAYLAPDEMPEMLAETSRNNLNGDGRPVGEGLIIRQSYVENGKIVIPRGGLMWLERGGEYNGPLRGEPMRLFGKDARIVGQQEAMLIKKNFFAPLGAVVPLAENDIAIKVTGFRDRYYGINVGSTTFVMPTGHTGWNGRVATQSEAPKGFMTSKSAIAYGDWAARFDEAKEGYIDNAPRQYFADPWDADMITYWVADEVTPEGVHFKEVGVTAVRSYEYTYAEPVRMALKVGETKKVGSYTVKVVNIDAKAGTAEIAILGKGGKVLDQKVLGPITDDIYATPNWIHHNQDIRKAMALRVDDLKVQLSLTYNKAGDTFPGNRVALVAFSEVKDAEFFKPWQDDPRFEPTYHYI